MNSTGSKIIAISSLCVACAGEPTVTRPRVEPTGPSVLWISLDTVRADHLSLYGGRASCPNLQAVADEGLVFEQAISHFPETQFSHWSMLTGVLPEAHGNVPGTGGSAYTGPTIAELTVGAGYDTAAFIGGVTLLDRDCGLSRGFQLYDDQFVPDPLTQARPASEVTRAAVSWIETRQGPWFAFVHYFDAHFPYTPQRSDLYDHDYHGTMDGTEATLAPHRDHGAPMAPRDLEHVVALYDAEITELDDALASLLAATGPDTMVVITSDHGESFENGYLFNHRSVLYDSVLHVPLIVKAPGLTPGRVARQVGLVDLLPTVATVAGLPLPKPIHGRSLLTRAPDGGLQPASAAHGEDSLLWARTDPWLPGALLAARGGDHKAIWDEHGQGRAYDLAADPSELEQLPVPPQLSHAPNDYRLLLQQMAPLQRPLPLRVLPLDAAERLRLEALGYLPHRPEPDPTAKPGSP